MLVKFPTTEMPVLGGVVAGKTVTVKSVVAPGDTVLGFAPKPISRVEPLLPPQMFTGLEALRGAEGLTVEKSFALLSVS
jgi:hypothetical protein